MSFFVKKNSAGGSEFIGTTLKVVTACTVVYYIIYSIIKRFADNQKLQLIPLVLFAINFFILFEILFLITQKKIDYTTQNVRNILFQIILNILFLVYIFYFYLR
jgi:hypothetical protein